MREMKCERKGTFAESDLEPVLASILYICIPAVAPHIPTLCGNESIAKSPGNPPCVTNPPKLRKQ